MSYLLDKPNSLGLRYQMNRYQCDIYPERKQVLAHSKDGDLEFAHYQRGSLTFVRVIDHHTQEIGFYIIGTDGWDDMLWLNLNLRRMEYSYEAQGGVDFNFTTQSVRDDYSNASIKDLAKMAKPLTIDGSEILPAGQIFSSQTDTTYQVHTGFYIGALMILDDIKFRFDAALKNYPNYTGFFVAHSLGAAVASHLVLMLQKDFGGFLNRGVFVASPGVGEESYCDVFSLVVDPDSFLSIQIEGDLVVEALKRFGYFQPGTRVIIPHTKPWWMPSIVSNYRNHFYQSYLQWLDRYLIENEYLED